MQSAPTTLPPTPVNEVTCGIDWARDDHAVSVVDAAGREIDRFTIAHTADGFRDLKGRLARPGLRDVGSHDARRGDGCVLMVRSPSPVVM